MIPAGEQSIGALVKEATAHVSTLVRAEVELARAEVTSEVKKGLQGSIFFIVALVIALFSLFYLFFALAELLAIWLNRAGGVRHRLRPDARHRGFVRVLRLPAGAQDPQARAHHRHAQGLRPDVALAARPRRGGRS